MVNPSQNALSQIYQGRGDEFIIPGQEDLVAQSLTYTFDTILDIGAGNLCATKMFLNAGKKVTATVNDKHLYNVTENNRRLKLISDINIETYRSPFKKYDAIWCAHVLEHTLNPGQALGRMRDLLKPNGWLFLSVPPFKHSVVTGHVSIGWNLGVLMYVLIHMGFDVRNGNFVWHGYNLSAFVQKGSKLSSNLNYTDCDIEALSELFPNDLDVKQGFNGNFEQSNWNWAAKPVLNKHPRNFIPKY